jgi:hypothetical protein
MKKIMFVLFLAFFSTIISDLTEDHQLLLKNIKDNSNHLTNNNGGLFNSFNIFQNPDNPNNYYFVCVGKSYGCYVANTCLQTKVLYFRYNINGTLITMQTNNTGCPLITSPWTNVTNDFTVYTINTPPLNTQPYVTQYAPLDTQCGYFNNWGFSTNEMSSSCTQGSGGTSMLTIKREKLIINCTSCTANESVRYSMNLVFILIESLMIII